MSIKDEVIKCCERASKIKDIIFTDETELTRENGIDSLGIVELVMELEEAFKIDLDSELMQIRKCQNISQLTKIIEEKK